MFCWKKERIEAILFLTTLKFLLFFSFIYSKRKKKIFLFFYSYVSARATWIDNPFQNVFFFLKKRTKRNYCIKVERSLRLRKCENRKLIEFLENHKTIFCWSNYPLTWLILPICFFLGVNQTFRIKSSYTKQKIHQKIRIKLRIEPKCNRSRYTLFDRHGREDIFVEQKLSD